MREGRLRKRMESMRSFMEVAKYLDENPKHFIPVPRGSSSDEIEKIKDYHRLSRKTVTHFLNSIVLEIAIKVIWELDQNKDCRNTHDIYELYNELDPVSQFDLRSIFDEKAQMLADMKINTPASNLGNLVQFQSWEDTLKANRDIMVNFKYDGEFNGKSSAMGTVIWSIEEDIMWALPPLNFVHFSEAVYSYTRDRVQRSYG